MGYILNVALAVLAISCLAFVALFGRIPAFRNTPIGFLHRLTVIHVPNVLFRADRAITGGRTFAISKRVGVYLQGSNPVVLILFLSLLSGSAAVFLASAWPHLPQGHYIIIILILPPPYIFTYLSSTSVASYITTLNHDQEMRAYPYDHIIFHPGVTCYTCKRFKPARSKHCPVCQTCIAKCDHHCLWINNCVGRANYRWFLALLGSLGCLLSYGAYLGWRVLSPRLRPTLRPGIMGQFDRWGVVMGQDAWVGGVGLLALLTAPLAWGLFAYHIYLVWAGMTTNETSKWSDLREDMADGIAFKGSRQLLPADFWSEFEGSGLGAVEPPTRWPVSSDQIVFTTVDGQPPKFEHDSYETRSEWERCWQLGEVDNLYDLGFWDNLYDALVPYRESSRVYAL